ncbi:cytochrome P450 [Mycena galericulata]|nr:cytochrome P450 [Mycena galericulata]
MSRLGPNVQTVRYIPEWTGVGLKREAKQFRRVMEDVRDKCTVMSKAQVAQRTAKASLTASQIQRRSASIFADRLPSFKDQPNLPYINALVLEVYRWNLAVPLAIPHRSVQEDVYNGFRIPAASTVVANSWFAVRDYRTGIGSGAIMHDEAVYPSAMEFVSERYLQQESSGDSVDPDGKMMSWSACWQKRVERTGLTFELSGVGVTAVVEFRAHECRKARK